MTMFRGAFRLFTSTYRDKLRNINFPSGWQNRQAVFQDKTQKVGKSCRYHYQRSRQIALTLTSFLYPLEFYLS